MPEKSIRIEDLIDFPCSIGTLHELFPEEKEEEEDGGSADFLNDNEEYAVY